jgi:hypothetical protein
MQHAFGTLSSLNDYPSYLSSITCNIATHSMPNSQISLGVIVTKMSIKIWSGGELIALFEKWGGGLF